jgi:hypothetical protein
MKKLLLSKKKIFAVCCIWIEVLLSMRCAEEVESIIIRSEFISEKYNHFEGGILFTDISMGLEILWRASFMNGKVYKENLGFVVAEGIIIAPNPGNTTHSAKINSMSISLIHGKLVVDFRNQYREVLAIIHTHPNKNGIQAPSPVFDYQFCYLGLHNYIITERHVFDAYKSPSGNEL